MRTDELQLVPGVPESALTDEQAETLTDVAAPAPWGCQAQAVLWTGRGGKAARNALAAGLRGRFGGLAIVGGMVRYLDTPVGAYDEVFGAVATKPPAAKSMTGSANVPFMAVDSGTSVVGGRSNWLLPKTLASFDGAPATGETMTATGASWRVSATAKAFGPAIPLAGFSTLAQPGLDGQVRTCRMKFRAKARPAIVTVEVDAAETLAGWLRSGRHLGLVAEQLSFTLGTLR